MISADVIIQAQFYDLDPLKVVWHGNYPRFLEQARCALLDEIGYNYDEMERSGYAWPIVDMRLKYVRPIKFAQKIKVTATLLEYETRLRISYRITDVLSGHVITKAETTQFPVSLTTGEVSLETPVALKQSMQRLAR